MSRRARPPWGVALAINKIRSGYQSLVRKWADPPRDDKSAEEKLDSLLTAHNQQSAQDAAAPKQAPSRLDELRRIFRDEMIPAFEEIKQKYGAQGIKLDMDASNFLEGHRKLAIEFSIKSHAVRLDGTVMETGIAFNEVRLIGGVPGAICSGPMLRTRQLTTDQFREFVCGRIALLVRSILRQRR